MLYLAFAQSHPEGVTQDDLNRLWNEAAYGQHNDQVFGYGSLYDPIENYQHPADHGSSPASVGNQFSVSQIEDLKKSIEAELRNKIEVELRKTIEEEVKKSMIEVFQQQLTRQRKEEDARFQ